MNVDILLSTSGDRIKNISTLIKSIDFSLCNLIICHQEVCNISPETRFFIEEQLKPHEGITYFSMKDKGVTKSRNFLVNKAESDYVIFCDDDIYYIDNSIKQVVESMNLNNIDVATGIVVTDGEKKFKKYSERNHKHNKQSILRVGTVEIVCRRLSILKTDLFPEDMGAGATYPLCDEPVFLNDCLNKSLKVMFLSIPLCYHPPISSGSNQNEKYTIARGVCFRRIFGRKALFLLVLFSLKMKIKFRQLKLFNYMKLLVRGYNEG